MPTSPRCYHVLRACSRICSTELQTILSLVKDTSARESQEEARAETSYSQKCRVEAEKYRITPRLAHKHSDVFQSLWPSGIPISVDPPQGTSFDPYTPGNLDVLHGTEAAVASKWSFSPRGSFRGWKSKVMTMRKYLKAFPASELDDNLVVKIEVSLLKRRYHAL